VLAIEFEDDAGTPVAEFRMGEAFNAVMDVDFHKPTENPTAGVNFVTDTGIMVADCRSSYCGLRIGRVVGRVRFRMRIAPLLLYPRDYFVEPWVSDAGAGQKTDFDWVRDGPSFTVVSGSEFLSGAVVTSAHGITYIPSLWRADHPNCSGGKGLVLQDASMDSLIAQRERILRNLSGNVGAGSTIDRLAKGAPDG
jgi:hypothetical protein